MADSEPSASPLTAATAELGAPASEAFELLGNETRLAILLTLWDAADPGHGRDAVSFTELRGRVGIRQGGRFNYHLDKLVGRFVERTDDGYALRHTGKTIVRTVIGNGGFEDASFERTAIEIPCRHCGGQTAVTYEDEWLYRVCTDCKGTFETPDVPAGCLSGFPLAPAAITDRTPEACFAVAKFQMLQSVHNKMEGICSACSGAAGQELVICQDHDPTGICESCGRAEPVRVRLVCEVCRDWAVVPVPTCLTFHPAVVGFYYDRGFSVQWNVEDFSTMRRMHELLVTETHLHREGSPRVTVTFSHGDDDLRITLDEELDVIETSKIG